MKQLTLVWCLIFVVMEIYKDYSNSYQFSNRRFKFCFYILLDNGLNVLFQICIFLKEVLYVQVLPRTSVTIRYRKEDL